MVNAYEIYKQQALNTSSPQELVGKLFDAAAIATKRGVLAIRDKNIQSANDNIVKAENIICALDGSLDMQYPVSEQLHELYRYINRRLMNGNINKDTEILEEAAGLIFELRDTWEQAFNKHK